MLRCSPSYSRGKIMLEKVQKETFSKTLMKNRRLFRDENDDSGSERRNFVLQVFRWEVAFRPNELLFSSIGLFFLRISSEKEHSFMFEEDAPLSAWTCNRSAICQFMHWKRQFQLCKNRRAKIGSWTNRLYPNPLKDFQLKFLRAYQNRWSERKIAPRKVKRFEKSWNQGNRYETESDIYCNRKTLSVECELGSWCIEESLRIHWLRAGEVYQKSLNTDYLADITSEDWISAVLKLSDFGRSRHLRWFTNSLTNELMRKESQAFDTSSIRQNFNRLSEDLDVMRHVLFILDWKFCRRNTIEDRRIWKFFWKNFGHSL